MAQSTLRLSQIDPKGRVFKRRDRGDDDDDAATRCGLATSGMRQELSAAAHPWPANRRSRAEWPEISPIVVGTGTR